MPKTPKARRKIQPKTKHKPQPAPVSITARKSYWIVLTASMVVFGTVYGYLMNVAAAAIGILLATVLSLIGFSGYLKFKPSTMPATKRATFIFAGASIIGFLIWVAIVLSLNATGFEPQITSSIGNGFFAITSLIICLTAGAFIGDVIGKNKERISIYVNKLRQ
jgi:hypothetical protein